MTLSQEQWDRFRNCQLTLHSTALQAWDTEVELYRMLALDATIEEFHEFEQLQMRICSAMAQGVLQATVIIEETLGENPTLKERREQAKILLSITQLLAVVRTDDPEEVKERQETLAKGLALSYHNVKSGLADCQRILTQEIQDTWKQGVVKNGEGA
jgi:hypothetical protein